MAIFFWPQHNYSIKLFELLNKENINISVINAASVKNAFDSFYAVLTGNADAAAFKNNAPKLFNGENNLYQQILALMIETIDKTPEYSAMTIVSNKKYYFDSHKSLLDCFELLKTKTPVIPITAAGLITGKIVVFDNGDTKAMTGMGFSKISLGEDGTLFGVTTTGSAMYGNIKTTGMATLAPISSTIKYSKIVCADSMIVFCIDTLGKLYKKDAANKWTVVNPGTTVGTFRDISVAKDGTIVAVNTKNEIYKFDGGVWTKIFTDTVINKIAICDKNNIWRVNTAFQIFKYDGSEWTEISTSFKCLTITVNSKNEVLAIESSTFAIYSYENGEWKKSDLPIGIPIDIDIK